MPSLLSLLLIRPLGRRPGRALLATLGIALGVALVLAIQVINGSTLGFFRETVVSFAGNARLTVSGGEAGFPEQRLERVREVEGVASAVPTVEARATFTAADGTRRNLMVFGIDLLNDSAIRAWKTEEQDVVEDPLEFLNQPESIIVTRTFAEQHGLDVESPIELMTAFGTKTFVVRGLLTPEGPAKAFGGGLAIMDIDGARVMFGKEGRTDRIDVVPGEKADLEALSERIEDVLGPGYQVERPEGQAEAFDRMVEGYQVLLSFLSTLALLVGMLLVANTLAMSAAERRRELALLRVVGASRRMLVGMVVAEAALLGLVGGVLGVGLGWLQAKWLVGWVSQSMSRQYVTPIDVTTLDLQVGDATTAVAWGVVVALVASAWPAVKTTRIPCLDALRPVESDQEPRARRRAAVVRGVGLVLLVAVLPAGALVEQAPVLRGVLPVLALFGAVLGSPLLVAWLVRAVRRLGRYASGPGAGAILRLACDNLLRNPRRTGSNVISLVIGLLLVVVIATLHRTFESTLVHQIDRSMPNSVVITSMGRIVSLQVQPLHEDLGAQIASVPGVSVQDGIGAYGFRAVKLRYRGDEIALKAWDRPHPKTRYEVFDMSDRPAAEAGPELFDFPEDAPTAMVSRNFTQRYGLGTGKSVTIPTPEGELTLRIVGVVNDLASPNGTVFIDRRLYKRVWKDPLVTAFAVQVAEGVPPDQLRDRIDQKLGPSRGILAVTTAGVRRQLREMLDESFAYTRAIEAAALLVGLLGLLNTAVVSVLGRTRELGMLRAVGMTRRQLGAMILVESLLQGVFGGIVAAAVGAGISVFWLVHELTHTLGWVLDIVVPWTSLGWTVAAGVGVGILAGLVAARRAVVSSLQEALSHE